ncbi:MAG TPA: electron transport complex subunit RsxC [Clostridia bacterium]|nr:electron transport complex subunit RsxC [Clostridia bacterium]
MIKQFKKIKGGVILPHNKGTSEIPSKIMPIPELVEIPMQQHIGAPCETLVKKGDKVYVGQIIGDSKQFVSVPIHSSVSGEVTETRKTMLFNGTVSESVVIKADGLQTILPEISKPDISNKENFLKAVRNCGLTGLGGAGFPAHVKLNTKDRIPEYLIVNAVECEPYITCDYRAIIEDGEEIIKGIKLILDNLSIPKAYIGIEDNKCSGAEKLEKLASEDDRIDVVVLKTKYPQGAEKMLIYALTGKKVPMGGLPIDVGTVVMNVTSVQTLARYCETGIPLISRRMTIDGKGVKERGNYHIVLGTYIKDIFEFCKGDKEKTLKILCGGPMMGMAAKDLDMPVIKQNNALLFMTQEDLDFIEESACIRCGRCIDACPMGLMPLTLNKYALAKMTDELEKYNLMNCIECGACSYVCPAKRHLVQSFRIGKELLKKEKVKNG